MVIYDTPDSSQVHHSTHSLTNDNQQKFSTVVFQARYARIG